VRYVSGRPRRKTDFKEDPQRMKDQVLDAASSGVLPVGPPKGVYSGGDLESWHAHAQRQRIEGYLDCLDGLIADGYPDPKFVEYLCEQVGREVPPPFFDRIMDENHHLRRQIALERLRGRE